MVGSSVGAGLLHGWTVVNLFQTQVAKPRFIVRIQTQIHRVRDLEERMPLNIGIQTIRRSRPEVRMGPQTQPQMTIHAIPKTILAFTQRIGTVL